MGVDDLSRKVRVDDSPLTDSSWPDFGVGAHAVDDRLRLFAWASGEGRHRYLWILRAFDRARQAYQVRLTVADVAVGLADLAEAHPRAGVPGPSDGADLAASLDALADWGVLDRSQESGRARTIAEYRRRASIYQFTELGFLAVQAVEKVVSARPDDAQLRALALGTILEDLDALALANADGDAAAVNRLLDRLHHVLTDLADRASRFYLMIGELGRVEEARPEVFLRHKDLLLAHLQEFHLELQRYAPLIAAAVERVRATDEGDLVRSAAAAETSPFATQAEREARWAEHWAGLVAWFVGSPGSPPTVARLDARTTAAIAELAALLRQVVEGRRTGVSRDAQLRHLAAWCWAAPTDDEAAALWSAGAGIRSARHLSIAEADPDAERPDRSWWIAEPVPVATTLRERGRAPSPGRPSPMRDDRALRRHHAERQLEARRADAAVAAALASADLGGRLLDRTEAALLLRLLDRALQTRTVAAGRLHAAGSAAGIRVRLRPDPAGTTVRTVDGVLDLPGVAIELEPLGSPT